MHTLYIFSKGRCQRTKLEPLPSYHRLVAHRIAERCLLARESSELFEYSMDGVSVAVRVIELIKTPETLIPSNLLIDHVENARKQSEEDGLSKVVKKMITRKDCHLGDSKRSKRRDQVKKDKVVKTMEDREIAYQKVRARIFGTEDRSKTPVEEVVQNVETGMSKVTLVNREEEMNDPDFVRRSDLGIGHNSLNGNANRVDGQQKNYASEDYDASQQGYPYRTNYNAGYAGGATEPRGRFQNSSSGRSDYSRNDYNRSDYNRKDYGRDDYSRNVHSNSSGTSLQVGNEQRRYYNDDRGGASSGTPPHRAHGGASMQRGPPPPSYQGQSNRRGRNSMPRQRPGSHLDQRPSKSYNKDFPPLG